MGQIHPQVAEGVDLPVLTLLFELDGQALLDQWNDERQYQPPSRFPALVRDLNVVVDRQQPAEEVRGAMLRELGALGRGVRLFDVYSGAPLPEDRVRLTFSLEIAAEDRTLTDEEAEQLLRRVRETLMREHQAQF
jgi:phenylalanyl-tRNA synthetase beta chain